MEMMMIGELARSNPTVQVPPWDPYDDQTVAVHSPYSVPSPTGEYLAALHRYLPSNEPDPLDLEPADPELLDEFLRDDFRMYVFKVRRCARGRSHDWTRCPYAHPGEKARRRDPRRFHYSGTPCPDFRKGACKKGDSCEFAHGVFECWLHPDRYRTQPCKDGPNCLRRVCFFAHSPDQLRVLPQLPSPSSVDSDYSLRGRLRPDTVHLTKPIPFLSSPPISSPSSSPPISPNEQQSVNELVASMRGLSFDKTILSPRSHVASGLEPTRCSPLSPGSYKRNFRAGPVGFNLWESTLEEEPAMERVESGRDVRARIYANLSKNNSSEHADNPGSCPDVGWVSELVK